MMCDHLADEALIEADEDEVVIGDGEH